MAEDKSDMSVAKKIKTHAVRIESLSRLPYDTLNRIKMGMVVCFESTGGFIEKRIVAYQRGAGFSAEGSKITHVAISIGGPYVVESTWPRSRAACLLADYQGRVLTFLWYKDKDFRESRRKNVAVWAATRCNLDYGLMALFGFYLAALWPFRKKNVLSSHRQPFCSYLAAWAYRRVGFDPFPGVSSDLITPAHFYDSDQFDHLKIPLEESGG